MRDREHPLAHGDVGWEDVLDEMCRALGHAPSAAARTEAPPLTGEGEQAFERAVAPANPGEAMGSTPQRRNFRNSLTTNAGSPTPSVCSRTVAGDLTPLNVRRRRAP